jgi:hypothetical protein
MKSILTLITLLWSAHVMAQTLADRQGIVVAQAIGGMSGIGGGLGGGGGGGGGSTCTGALDLSTGCAQLMAFGVLF